MFGLLQFGPEKHKYITFFKILTISGVALQFLYRCIQILIRCFKHILIKRAGENTNPLIYTAVSSVEIQLLCTDPHNAQGKTAGFVITLEGVVDSDVCVSCSRSRSCTSVSSVWGDMSSSRTEELPAGGFQT